MPVSLNKIRKLQDIAKQVKPDETSGYRRHNKNSPAYWQVVIQGKKVGYVWKTQERALEFINEHHLQKQLPVIERISINEFNRKRDTKTKERS